MGVKSFPPAPPIQGSEVFGVDAEVVNPPHYRHAAVESIELIESMGHGKGFCYGNIIKYVYRAEHKGDERENLEKALWYIQRRLTQINKGE